MRKPIVAGNWKMNLTKAEATKLAKALAGATMPAGVDVAVCPPAVYLDVVGTVLAESTIKLGAQNVYHESPGAFTGEICLPMLEDLGCQYVILGHSERRNVLGETNEDVNRKVKAALAGVVTPIVCLGELLEQREAGQTMQVVKQQLDGSLADLTADEARRCVIAYEPVWAIGTGKVATPDQAEEIHAAIRGMLNERFGDSCGAEVRIQYGGSVKPDNASDLMSRENIDGALVGGASLKAESFIAIVAAAEAR